METTGRFAGRCGRGLLAALRWLGRLFVEVWGGWHRHRCTQLGAAIAFYGIFSLLPLLILLTSVFGFVLASWGGAVSFRDGLSRLLSDGVSPQVARIAVEALIATEEARGRLGLLGIGTLLLAAAGAFGQLESSLQVVWDTHVTDRPVPFRRQVLGFLRSRLVSFLLVGGVSLLVFASLAGDVFLDAFRREYDFGGRANWRLVQLGTGLFAAGWIVTLLYRLLPAKKVPWRAALVGGWLTAGLWEATKQLLSAYVRHRDYTRAYPLLGSALAILLWVYFAGLVFLLGAEVAAGITRMMAKRR